MDSPTLSPANTRVLLVGLGLIGGSYAQALAAQGFAVDAFDPDPDALAFARDHHWIVRAATTPSPAIARDATLVVFALYPDALLDWIRAYQHLLAPGTLLTDTTGVKTPVVAPVQALLRPDLEFIAAHPMAGREKAGIRNADASVFQGANYIVVPSPANTPRAIALCRQLGVLLGFRRISELSPEAHDAMVAYVSQLTHCIAVALMDCQDVPDLAAYTGDSFRDITRIADINDRLWPSLFLANRTALLRSIDLFADTFARLRAAVEADDVPALRALMQLSTARRRAFTS